ncbi:hypothetical protein SteCoe_5629 [Stentor coeruleus]|uniref:Uncharacterized protein n=1 Tax=Stentor coeruleus TaxID=5963 RepID=A0A1R2CRV5_9CILI|nr:hypothetical protein SteCoe_5629 [Stentor coeruleus]
MENNLIVYETPELQKTIEEINDEIEPKMFSHNLGIGNKPRELTLPEIFNAEKPKPTVFPYIKDPKNKELKRLKENFKQYLIFLTDDPDPYLYLECSELEEKLMRIKENSQSESKKHSFPSSSIKSCIRIPNSFGNDVAYEMSLTETEDRNRFSRLENKVRELEFAIGTWKQSKPICEILAEFLAKAKFLNLELLDRIKEQARHLGTDLISCFQQIPHQIQLIILSRSATCIAMLFQIFRIILNYHFIWKGLIAALAFILVTLSWLSLY